ncbi:CbtA family protein [Variovorax ginsengisoli]|uniref:Cobalt transporter subunit CbtA n=1 Tax=Variovorax ginsengisoli TaxID=363844 RepID=A0ABT9SBE8_9BURK|nr:CbtA family protein [Variovorax ginsengisoli]MDP9901173.1 cobalt transporter subunit CbtA [Variovorax ginsengisoli]
MMLFQRLIGSALAVAVVVGSVQTGVQLWQATPIIHAAERYESQKIESPAAPAALSTVPVQAGAHDHAHDHAHAAAPDWQPEDGAERTFWTWIANLLHAFSMALLVLAVMGVCLWRGTPVRSLPLAALVAAAGWLSTHFWPSLGLPAEIPGMDAARLGSRQGWWVLAAVSAALACGAVAGLRSPLRWPAAAAVLALPLIVGAPHIAADPFAGFSAEAQTALRALDAQFVQATTWIAVSFWLSMALACGLAFERWLRPTLAQGFGGNPVVTPTLEPKA